MEILEARVKQKTDTEANWLANPLIILDGECAFVLGPDNITPINFKIGDGTKNFSALPYWINYAANVVVATVAPGGTLPNAGSAGKLIVLAPGSYTNIGGGTSPLVAAANSFTVGFWDGTTWSIIISIPIIADLSLYTPLTSFNPVKVVTDGVQAGNILNDASYNSVNTGPNSSGASYLGYNKPVTNPGILKTIIIRLNARNEATQTLFTASLVGSTFTVKQVFTINLTASAGVKTVDVSASNIPIDSGDYIFIVNNTNTVSFYTDGSIVASPGVVTIVSHATPPSTGVTYALGSTQPTWSVDLQVVITEVQKILTNRAFVNSFISTPINSVPSVSLVSGVNDRISAMLDVVTTAYTAVSTAGYVNSAGTFVASAGWSCTDFLPIKYGDIVNYKGTTTGAAQAIVLFNADKTSVSVLLGTSPVNTVQSFLIPDGWSFVRMSAAVSSTPTFTITAATIRVKLIPFAAVLAYLADYKNIIYTATQTVGYINSSGSFINSAGWSSTGFIPVVAGDVVIYKGLTVGAVQSIMLYSADKSTVLVAQGNSPGTDFVNYTIPTGWAWVRMSGQTSSTPIFSVSRFVNRQLSLPSSLNSPADVFPTYDMSNFGDSITAMCDSNLDSDPTHFIFNGGWIRILAESLGTVTRRNYGVGGTGIGQMYTAMIAGSGQTVGKLNTIFIGTNDWTSGTALGNFTTDYVGNTGNATFAAKYRQVIDYIKTNNPGCFTVLFTPMYRGAVASTTKPESNVPVSGQYLSQFADMVIQIANLEGLGYVDFFRHGPINTGNCNIRSGAAYVTYDGVHPLDHAHVGMSKLILPVIKAHIY